MALSKLRRKGSGRRKQTEIPQWEKDLHIVLSASVKEEDTK